MKEISKGIVVLKLTSGVTDVYMDKKLTTSDFSVYYMKRV